MFKMCKKDLRHYASEPVERAELTIVDEVETAAETVVCTVDDTRTTDDVVEGLGAIPTNVPTGGVAAGRLAVPGGTLIARSLLVLVMIWANC